MSMATMFSGVCYTFSLTKDQWEVSKARKWKTDHGSLAYADIVMLLYDIGDRLTFDVLPEIREWTSRIRTTMPQLVVIATNTEISQETWDVSFEERKIFAEKIGAGFGTYSRDEALEALHLAAEAVAAMRDKAEVEGSSHDETPKVLHNNSSGDNSSMMKRVWQKLGFGRAH
jgi:hypothetical protein